MPKKFPTVTIKTDNDHVKECSKKILTPFSFGYDKGWLVDDVNNALVV